MKIILSRKGFDSSYGGYPSLILPNSVLLTLPIPTEENGIPYSSVKSGFLDLTLYEIMRGIKDSIYLNRRIPLTEESCCHLDPDLKAASYPRAPDWRGCFGQAETAQRVLEKNGVQADDLFLFFGWFHHYDYIDGSFMRQSGGGKHVLYGYLQIGEIIKTASDPIPDWLQYHPHTSPKSIQRETNRIYVARERLSWNGSVPGYGIFRYDKDLDLSKPGLSRSKWKLPDCFRGKRITYHRDTSWKENYFQSAGRGQEFVVEECDEVLSWAKALIESHACR